LLYLKKSLTEEALDAARIAISGQEKKWGPEPVCDFCSASKPVVVYASSRTAAGENVQCWRWMACAACEALVDRDNWSAVQDRAMVPLHDKYPDISGPELRKASIMALAEFHRYAVRTRHLKRDFTEEETRQVYDEMERRYPDLWRICYPRIYSENPRCGDYYSPKEPARQMMGIALKNMAGAVGRAEQYEFLVASHLVKYKVPMYWLSKDIAEAIRLTTPPGDLEWYAMPLPFDAAIFMLPKGAMRHPTEGNVEFIAYGRFHAGERHVSRLVKGEPYGSINGAMCLLAYTEAGHLTHWNMPLDAFGEKIKLPDADELVMRFSDDRHESGWFYQPEMTNDDNGMLVDLMHFIFGTLLLMTERPDMVTLGSQQRRVITKASNIPKEFWTPNVIGQNYILRRPPSEYQGGHHASPRFHWVRGFYREQHIGPRVEQQKKRIWIEPFTRGLGA